MIGGRRDVASAEELHENPTRQPRASIFFSTIMLFCLPTPFALCQRPQTGRPLRFHALSPPCALDSFLVPVRMPGERSTERLFEKEILRYQSIPDRESLRACQYSTRAHKPRLVKDNGSPAKDSGPLRLELPHGLNEALRPLSCVLSPPPDDHTLRVRGQL